MASRREILHTKVITKVVRRVAGATSVLLNRFGMQAGGSRVDQTPQRKSHYDIFDDTRTVGLSRAPGVQSATVRRKAAGHVSYTIPRLAEHLPLTYEELHNQRTIGGSNADIDSSGQSYIRRQARYLAQRAANWRLALLGGMLRGKLYLHENGDDMYPSYTASGATFTIDYQIPAGNRDQLDMLGGGNIINTGWQSATANIPDHIMQINAAFQQLTGSRLELAVINSSMWTHLVNNDYVVSQAGVSNPAFRMFSRGQEVTGNGLPDTTFEAVLSCVPWLRWIITDEGIDMGATGSESYTKFIPDNYVWFGPDPTRPQGIDMMEMLEGPEPISEGPNRPPAIRNGLHSYAVEKYDPASIDLHTVDNALPVLYVPKSVAWAQVANF